MSSRPGSHPLEDVTKSPSLRLWLDLRVDRQFTRVGEASTEATGNTMGEANRERNNRQGRVCVACGREHRAASDEEVLQTVNAAVLVVPMW
jgi:hypothetical protein